MSIDAEYKVWLQKVGLVFRSIRKGKGLNQKEMAIFLDESYQRYNYIELGKKPITTRILFRLAKKLNTDVYSIIKKVHFQDVKENVQEEIGSIRLGARYQHKRTKDLYLLFQVGKMNIDGFWQECALYQCVRSGEWYARKLDDFKTKFQEKEECNEH